MSHVVNDPVDFAREYLAGFVNLHRDTVVAVPGGVVRADQPAGKTVAIVTGGGSGHYPAFCGWVGPGLADGAAIGDVFASPSADQIISVARAAENGAGVVFIYGNYAGDVLNFTQAQRVLEAEGIVVTNLPVCDDITSAPISERENRRGTAGDLIVLKVAGAAAAAGLDHAQVSRLAQRANERTGSFGIAFSGCTFPGASEPLFSLVPGTMGVGMGVHGEPGISEEPIATARDLAQTLVNKLLEERPADQPSKVIALLNGLGATGYEELFLLWADVQRELVDADIEIAFAEVDELITSLDMAGLSLTLCWLDDELADLWSRPCQSAAYSRGRALAPGAPRDVTVSVEAAVDWSSQQAPEASQQAAKTAARVLDAVRVMLGNEEVRLGNLDAVAGDGDHGHGMVRGARAASDAAREISSAGVGLGRTVTTAGQAWAAASGGTSGALWGTMLEAAGTVLADDEVTAVRVSEAVNAARDALVHLGGAKVGDKTMLDALEPFAQQLSASIATDPGRDSADDATGITALFAAWSESAAAAKAAADATCEIVARVGRARPLGERSLGTPDPGAISLALVLEVIGTELRSAS